MTFSPDDFLAIDEVARVIHRSKQTIYRDVANGAFPRPVKLGAKSYWMRGEVDGWIANCIAARDEVRQ